MNTRTKLAVVGAVLGLSGCELTATGVGTPLPQEHSLEGVKRISTSIDRGDDPASFEEADYPVSREDHLLLRLESLDEHVKSVRVDEGHHVELMLTLMDEADEKIAATALQVCPITRAWMMLATWKVAHPFGRDGEWGRAGGDFDSAACVPPTQVKDRVVTFDVTQWFIDYPKGREMNFGLLVQSEVAITIAGDQSSSHSPRLKWDE